MPRFETEMEVCPHCRRAAEAKVEYIRDGGGNVVQRVVRDINCRYANYRVAKCPRTGASRRCTSRSRCNRLCRAPSSSRSGWDTPRT